MELEHPVQEVKNEILQEELNQNIGVQMHEAIKVSTPRKLEPIC